METTINSKDISQPESLDSHCSKYIQAKQNMTFLEDDLKNAKENHPDFAECQKAWNTVKYLREKIKLDPSIANIKSRLKTQKETMKLQAEIIAMKLREQQLTLFPFADGKFVLRDDLRFKKNRKKKSKF